MNTEKLVKMANQIAANFDYGPDKAKAAAGVADHLRRFWSPPMKTRIIEHHRSGSSGLSEVAAMAVETLAEEQATDAA